MAGRSLQAQIAVVPRAVRDAGTGIGWERNAVEMAEVTSVGCIRDEQMSLGRRCPGAAMMAWSRVDHTTPFSAPTVDSNHPVEEYCTSGMSFALVVEAAKTATDTDQQNS